jgi:hypothetical protein
MNAPVPFCKDCKHFRIAKCWNKSKFDLHSLWFKSVPTNYSYEFAKCVRVERLDKVGGFVRVEEKFCDIERKCLFESCGPDGKYFEQIEK